MQKYNYDLEMVTPNSNERIIRHIQKGKDILEFGPAYGRLTKYLHLELDCNVDIVEIDEESGRVAAQYARTACLGPIAGDIEGMQWKQMLHGRCYDYIIFADVLEHLRHPENVLKEISVFLKDGGMVLCSFPNIAHSSIIISLWNNDFSYSDVGLLDNTHVHFFTRSTFEKMVEDIGYQIIITEEILSEVGSNEVKWNYSNIPSSVEKELKFREEGNIYQYVFGFQKSCSTGEMNVCTKKVFGVAGIECTCFIREQEDADYTESKYIKTKFFSPKADIQISLDNFKNVKGLCVTLAPNNSLIRIVKVEVNGKDAVFETSGLEWGEGVFGFDKETQIFIAASESPISYLHLVYEILLLNEMDMKHLNVLINSKRESLQIMNEKLLEEKLLMEKTNLDLSEQKKCLENEWKVLLEEKQVKENEIRDKDEILREKEQMLREKEQMLKEKEQQLEMLENRLEEMEKEQNLKFFDRLCKKMHVNK